MSALRVLWPDEEVAAGGVAIHEPAVIPFAVTSTRGARGEFDVVTRARALFDNRCCQTCGYPVVEPIELADGLKNRNGMVIPGTATLVGFRCCGCRAEWSA